MGSDPSISTGGYGDSKSWPPGFRFHPTDEELVLYYLKGKLCRRRCRLDMIGEVDVYKFDPWELPEKSVLQTGDKLWFFFSPRDKKYKHGARSNRATKHGYWKATGKDRSISQNSRPVGVKKTLIFYTGRAPKGKRTNWVMHEYTMDEEELKKCNVVQQSYAVYKIYMKSGAGPKNGEQYGAPFREEEWFDDDQVDDSSEKPKNQANPVLDLTCSHSVDGLLGYDQSNLDLTSDLEEFLRQMCDGPEVNHQQLDNFEIGGEDQIQSLLLRSLEEEIFPAEPGKVLCPQDHITGAQQSLPLTDSGTSLLQSYEAPEVTSAFDQFEQETPRIEEDFVELNDLIDLEPAVSSLESISNCTFQNPNGLNDNDIFFDAPIFHPEEFVPPDSTEPQQYLADTDNQLDYFLAPHFHYDYQSDATHLATPLWSYEENFNVVRSIEASQVVMEPPASGVVYSGSSTRISDGAQGPGTGEGDALKPWFTSAIHTLLESIPSQPASASENGLINRAFERMSSFGAMHIGARDVGVETVVGAVGRGRGSGKGGFLFVSFLGALWAVLWVLMVGTTYKIVKSFFSRFIPS